MVKRGSKTVSLNIMGETNAMVVEMTKKILAMEKKIGRLRHHVLILSKRELGLKKKLLSVEKGKKKEEVAGSVAEGVAIEDVVAEAEGLVPEADAVADSVAGMCSGESVVPDSVTTGDEDMEMDDDVAGLKDTLSDENVVVDGRIVPLKRYTPVASAERVRRVEVLPPREQLAMMGRGRVISPLPKIKGCT